MDISYVDYEKDGIAVTEKLKTPCWMLRGVQYRFQTKELAELYYNTLKQIGIDPDEEKFFSSVDWQELHTGVSTGNSRYDTTLYTIARGKDIGTTDQALEAARKTAKNIKEYKDKKIEESS